MRNMMLGLALLSMPALAQQAQQAPPAGDPAAGQQQSVAGADGIRTEATVVVDGEQPGPGLWLVRKGDHDLYILGTLSPLPAKMQWQSGQVQRVIGDAQEVIRPPGVAFGVKVGFFKGLTLVPAMLGARKNPDDKSLQQVVSPASYARWTVLKARYIGRDSGVEKWRPLFAAQELYKEAMEKHGLDNAKSVWPVINQAIEAHHPNVTITESKITVTDPKPLLKEFSRTTLADTACFDATMARIEGDLDKMRARANAWATGDVAALQALPVANNYTACMDAISDAGIGRKLGFRDAFQQSEDKWFAAVDAALAKNVVTFAVLDIGQMVGPDGYLAKLKAKGYTVLAPDE